MQQEHTRVDKAGQQPPRPEVVKEAGIEKLTNEAPRDPFEQSLLDILDEQ